jgi:HAD superfamily hydrolase (TIGR01450 family)
MPSQVEFAIVFDVDGVLLHDYHPIKGAQQAMQLLKKHNIPFIFLSNGGGRVEEIQAMKYSKALETNIPVENVIVSHTPMKELSPQYKNQRVLIFGLDKDHSMQLAKKYSNGLFI